MDDAVIIKQCARSPQSASEQPNISFRHPSYDDPEDILFTLPRLDWSLAGAAPGVHHGTALLACQIIANNAFDGYLNTDRSGATKFVAGGDGDGEGEGVYPVVPRFEEWHFPHGYMGSLAWEPGSRNAEADPQTLPTSAPVPTSTPLAPPPPRSIRRCILSDNPYAIQKAHVVPTAQSKWFQVNSMKRYGDSQRFIHTEQNQVPIRHDLHKLWDDNVFALVPKEYRGGHTFVVMCLIIGGLRGEV